MMMMTMMMIASLVALHGQKIPLMLRLFLKVLESRLENTRTGNAHLGICAVGSNEKFTNTSCGHRSEDNNNTTGFIMTV